MSDIATRIAADWSNFSDEQKEALFALYASDRMSEKGADVGKHMITTISEISDYDFEELVNSGYIICTQVSIHNGEMRYSLNEKIAAFVFSKFDDSDNGDDSDNKGDGG